MQLPAQLQPYFQLTRLDRPIGIYLLLWPTLWALWFAAEGIPSWRNLVIFTLGVVLMRSADCAINDYADREFDGHVARTQQRPIVTGAISPKQALIVFSVLVLIAFGLVLLTNQLTILLALGAVALAACYPFAKRHTHLPQIVLGAAFAWAIPMAFAAETNAVPQIAWTLFISTLTWIVAYDTYYAMVDREDDLKIGVKSTAILFGDMDLTIVRWLQTFTLVGLVLVGSHFGMGINYYLGLLAAGLLFVYQQRLSQQRAPEGCFKAFLNNNWVGMVIFIGIATDYQWPILLPM